MNKTLYIIHGQNPTLTFQQLRMLMSRVGPGNVMGEPLNPPGPGLLFFRHLGMVWVEEAGLHRLILRVLKTYCFLDKSVH